MRRSAAACPFRLCCAPTSRSSPRCATCLGKADARIEREDGAVAEWSIEAADGVRRDLADGRSVSERTIALPTLPIGRHRLIVDGVECALTVAPPHAYSPDIGRTEAFWRGGSALRPASRGRERSRPRDRRLFRARDRRRTGRPSRRGLSRRQPAAYAVPARPRPGEPVLPLGSPLPRSDLHRCARRFRPPARRGAQHCARVAGAAVHGRVNDKICRVRGGMACQARGAPG